ncbi:unnamed protein product [Merluccius merluccius]
MSLSGLLVRCRSLCAFCFNILCRHRFILGVVSVGIIPCIWRFRARLRAKGEAEADAEDPQYVSRPHHDDQPSVVTEEEDTEAQDNCVVCDSLQVSIPEEQEEQEEEQEEEEQEEEEEASGRYYTVEATDPLYCEYDSTWETDGDPPQRAPHGARPPREPTHMYKFTRFQSAAKDMYNYRHDYPENEMPNLDFYLGKMASVPDDVYIHEFHRDWWGDFAKLERVHSFIQWLFPLQETGMNHEAYELTKQEIEAFCNNDKAKCNLQESYKLMLHFYGIELSNPKTGKVERASNWQERFRNLNRNTHNNLRLTRILKCLGTLGYQHYQAPLVRFFLEETLVHGNIAAVKESVLNYFLFAVLDKEQRRELVRFAYLNYEPKEEFIWCPKKMQRRFSSRKKVPSGPSNPAYPSPEEWP